MIWVCLILKCQNGWKRTFSKSSFYKKDDLKEMPIIFLTSKDQEQDEIIGLRMGQQII